MVFNIKLQINLSIIILFLTLKLIGQESTFSITFKSDYEEQLQDIAEDNYGNYYGVGRQKRFSPAQEIPIIWKVTRNQDTASAIFPQEDSLASFLFIKYRNDGLLEILGDIGTVDRPKSSILYYLLDTSLNILDRRVVQIPNLLKISTSEVLYSQSAIYLFANTIDIQDNQKPGIIKLNIDLSISSIASYNYSPNGYFTEAFFSADSSRIFTYTGKFNSTKATSPTQLFVIDTLLNFQSIKNLPTDQIPAYSLFYNYLSGGLISEDRFIVCGSFDHGDIHSNESDIAISIIDSSMNSYSLSYFGGFDTLDLAAFFNTCDFRISDSIFVVSTLNVGDWFFPSTPSTINVRLYNDSLDVIFNRNYGGDAHYWTTNILATADGGCLIGCYRYDLGPLLQRDTYFLKLNKEGLLVYTRHVQKEQQKPYSLNYISNSDIIEVDLLAKNGLLKMYDFSGRLLDSTQIRFGKNYIRNKNNNHVILIFFIDNHTFTEKL